MRGLVAALLVTMFAGWAAAAPRNQQPAADQAPAAASQTPAGNSETPPEAGKMANPVKPTAESLARGKKDYGYDCAICHGEDGSGKGELVDSMKLTLKDYRDPASLKDLTDGEIFYIIKNGKGAMTGEGDRRKPSEIWDMVNYVRSFSKKAPPATRHKPASQSQ
jgi:mono/diheme cytochrome c family protein